MQGKTVKGLFLYVGKRGAPRLFLFLEFCLFVCLPYPLEQVKTGIKILLLNFVCVYIPVDYFAKQDTSFLVFPRARPKHRCRLSFLRQFLRWVPCARWRGRPRGRERVRFWGNPNSLLKVPGKNDFSYCGKTQLNALLPEKYTW